MKILTISIAAYNVERYIDKALESLIIRSIDKLEVLIQDDGSKDKTSFVAKKYEKMYPESIKVIKKENGGYGSTINNSINMATGKYFKQLDGDDWYDTNNLELLVKELEKINADIIYTPYYKYFEYSQNIEIVNDLKKQDGNYELEKFFKEINQKKFIKIMMHSLIFKTNLLKENNIKCLENCFYTDNEYVLYPLLYSEKLYILNLPIYCYRIGREGQSISIEGRRKHYIDIIKVCKRLLNDVIFLSKEKSKDMYILDYTSMLFDNAINNFLLILPISKENLRKIKEFDLYIKNKNLFLYKKMEEKSKTIFLLRKSNYFLYPILHYRIIFKLKKSLKNE